MTLYWNDFIDSTVGKAANVVSVGLNSNKVYSRVEFEMLSSISFGIGFNDAIDSFLRAMKIDDNAHLMLDEVKVWKTTIVEVQNMMLNKLMSKLPRFDVTEDDYKRELTIEI